MEKLRMKKLNFQGLKLAAVYGLAPNRLGFCGPQGKKNCQIISRYLEGGSNDSKIKNFLKKFEAAYSYLELIAKKNKIKDPFDLNVVKAFWVGSPMLEKISAKDIEKMILKKFTKSGLLSKKEAKKRIALIRGDVFPHHSFHVYILGAITGRVSLEDFRLKDICRVGWGEVKKIKNPGEKGEVTVFYKPIIEGKRGKFKFGRNIKKEISWNEKIFPDIKIGDQVSFHWNVLCQKLSQNDILNLGKYTKYSLRVANL